MGFGILCRFVGHARVIYRPFSTHPALFRPQVSECLLFFILSAPHFGLSCHNCGLNCTQF